MKKLILVLLVLLLSVKTAFSQPQFMVPMDLHWSGPADTLKVFVVGDIMSHGKVRQSAEVHGYETFFKYIENKIQDADLAIGNMEFPLAGPPYSGYPVFSGPDSFAAYLQDVGFGVLLTANNHILDKGVDGMRRTIDMLESMGIPYTGISRNAEVDTLVNPLMVHIGGVKLALINFTYGTEMGSQTQWPKVNYMNKERLLPILQRARRKADLVLVFPHWGEEYHHFHNARQEEFARFLVDNGADAVIGGHPHVVQDVQEINGVPVVYSLGNALSNQNDLPARFEAALTLRIVYRFGEPAVLLPPEFDYLWCTKPGMVEVSYSAVPVTSSKELWKDQTDYENMKKTLSSLEELGIIRK